MGICVEEGAGLFSVSNSTLTVVVLTMGFVEQEPKRMLELRLFPNQISSPFCKRGLLQSADHYLRSSPYTPIGCSRHCSAAMVRT